MNPLPWLLLSGSGEEGRPQPIRPCLAGSEDSGADGSRFFRRQPDRKDINCDSFLRQPRAPHFLGHKKFRFRVRKCLTRFWPFVYKRQVSTETLLSSEKVAGTAAGESELTNSLPVCAGASRRESEMSAETFQAGTSDRRFRSLKVEAVGDFARRKVIPRIRIAGQWLEQAGFKPGHRVQVSIEQSGNLSLRFLEQAKEAGQ